MSEFNLYRGDPVATVDRALAAAPGFLKHHSHLNRSFLRRARADATIRAAR